MIVIDLLPILAILLIIAVVIVCVQMLRIRDAQEQTRTNQLTKCRAVYGALFALAVIIVLGCSFVALAGGASTASKLLGGRGAYVWHFDIRPSFIVVNWPNDTAKVFAKDNEIAARAYAEEFESEYWHVPVDSVNIRTIISTRGLWGSTTQRRAILISGPWRLPPDAEKNAPAWLDQAESVLTQIIDKIKGSNPDWWSTYGHLFPQVVRDEYPYIIEQEEVRAYPPGYIHNVITLVAFAAMPFCFVRWRAYRRATKLAEEGRCIKCGYDLRDKLDRGCPECGWR